MKTCFKCGISKEDKEFYRHPEMKDGRLGKCKECAKADVIQNRAKNHAYYLAFDKSRAMLPHRIQARNEYDKTPQGIQAHRKAKSKWIKSNPRKRAAQLLFMNRKRYDPSLGRKPCERCGADKVHAHHENYDEPLKVTWLCPKHHKERHREMKKEGIEP